MNIVRLVYEWPPPWHGLAPGPYEISRAQARLGHRVVHLCGGWPRRPAAAPRQDGITVRRLPAALPGLSLFATTAPAAWLAVMRRSRRADLVHGHGHMPAWIHAHRRWVSNKFPRNLPYVLHLHVTAAGRAEQAAARGNTGDFWTRRFEWPLHQLSDRWGCQTAAAVICVSESVKKEVLHFYNAPLDRVHVVPNGVNTALFQPSGPHARSEWGLADDDKIILSVGSLTRRKRPGLLIDVLRHLDPSWKLLLVGDGPLKENLKAQAAQQYLSNRVVFAGLIPYPKLPAVYRAADVLALAATYEGYPKVILEALASGVPVITTRSFTPDPHLADELTVCQDDNPAEIAVGIREAVGRTINTWLIADRFSWDTRVKAVQAIYDELC